jgi:hypothetical protein
MKSIKMTGLCLAAVFAFGAIGVSQSFAASTNNPQWEVASKILGEGESKPVVAKANGAQKLKATGITISCASLKVENANIKGSKAPNPGTDEEVIVYEECEVEGKPNCEINKEKSKVAKIKTVLLKSTLAFQTKVAAEAESAPTVTVFEPKEGTKFTTFELTGIECLAQGVISVEGQVACENPKGQEQLAKHELNCPEPAIKKYFVNEGAVTVEKLVKELRLEGVLKLAATYVGKASVELTSKELWGVFN